MTTPPKLFFLNGSFDLAFLKAPLDRYAAQFAEMTSWFVPVANHDDTVILDCDLPMDYFEYLRGMGLEIANTVAATPGKSYENYRASCWGWNTDALDRFKQFGANINCPDIESVRRVNSRQFSHALAKEHGLGSGGEIFSDSATAISHLKSLNKYPYVVKPCFGNSGIGFLHIKSAADAATAEKKLGELFANGNPAVVIEPWLHRSGDISSRFELDETGVTTSLEHYQTLTTSNGAFYGMTGGPGATGLAPWRAELDRVAAVAGNALHTAGYFGPVSIDHMIVADDNGNEKLIALLEINARQAMSFIALRLRDLLAPTGCWLFRSVGEKMHNLPSCYDDWMRLSGDHAYDPRTRQGIVCVTPLTIAINGTTRKPQRSLFFLAAASSEQLKFLDGELTRIVRKNHGV